MTKTLLIATMMVIGITPTVSAQEKNDDVDAVTSATKQENPCEKPCEKNTEGKTAKFLDAVSRLHIGGYGEAVMTRNFYSQSFNRYKNPENYANDKSHGRFDLPHVCLNIGYDFG